MQNASVSPLNHDVRDAPEKLAKTKAGFGQRGESVVQWAVSRGYNPILVHQVLAGRLKCSMGKSHQIAIDLGLKPVPPITIGE